MVLHPARDAARKGVGCGLADTGNCYAEACLYLVLYNVSYHQITLLSWHICECRAAKKSEVPEARGRRLLRILRVLGKGLFAARASARRPGPLPPEHHGYARRRRRGAALLAVMATAHRPRQMTCSYAGSFQGAANAP
eukprot:5805487-Pyramimonas_sp.AAC.1